MMPCNNYYMVYTYSFLKFYVKHEYVRLSGQSKCCQQHIPSENIQAFIICMSTFFNTVLLIFLVIAAVFSLLYDE